MAKDGSPFILHGNGNYTCCHGVFNCGNHVPDWAEESWRDKQKKGIRPCGNKGPCKCFAAKDWTGDGTAKCKVLEELEEMGKKGLNVKRRM